MEELGVSKALTFKAPRDVQNIPKRSTKEVARYINSFKYIYIVVLGVS